MPSKNTTSLGLNQWDASDKPVREDFVRDNTIINDKITQLNSDLTDKAVLKGTNNVLSGKNQFIASNGLSKDSFYNASILCKIPETDYEWARPGIGFERAGVEACYLYFEGGKFYFIDHAGFKHQIQST